MDFLDFQMEKKFGSSKVQVPSPRFWVSISSQHSYFPVPLIPTFPAICVGFCRVSSMPYYALVLEGSFVANGRALRRGEFCQSEAVERLQLLGSDGRDIKDGNLTIVCWDLQHVFFSTPKITLSKEGFHKTFSQKHQKTTDTESILYIFIFFTKKRNIKNVSQRQIVVA